MKCRSIKKHYHSPNPVSYAEAHAHHLRMMFYPFRKESELVSPESNTYIGKLNEIDVANVINSNKLKFEPWGDVVNEALLNYTFQPKTYNSLQNKRMMIYSIL